MIEVENLNKIYGSQLVLNRVNIKFAQGQVTGILGPNACGKTTLMKCLLGLALPDSGEIRFAGKRLSPTGDFKRLIGYMPQNPNFPANLTAKEQLDMLEDLRQQTASLRAELTNLFGLEENLNKSFGQLSGGTKQKVAAVGAFMFQPPIIILDEPTASLDPIVSLKLKQLIRKTVADGATIILVSHLVSEVQDLASQMVFFLEGRVVYSGTAQNLLRQAGEQDLEQALAKCFAGQIEL